MDCTFPTPTEDEVGFIGSNAWLDYVFAEGSTIGRPRSSYLLAQGHPHSVHEALVRLYWHKAGMRF